MYDPENEMDILQFGVVQGILYAIWWQSNDRYILYYGAVTEEEEKQLTSHKALIDYLIENDTSGYSEDFDTASEVVYEYARTVEEIELSRKELTRNINSKKETKEWKEMIQKLTEETQNLR